MDNHTMTKLRERADIAVLGIGHLLTHLPDNDGGFSEMANEDLIAIYAVYTAEVMKRDPGDWAGNVMEHLAAAAIPDAEG